MNKEYIGKRIRRAREERNITQAQLAEKLHLSSNYIGLIERNVNTPSVSVLVSIADELGVSMDYLVGTHTQTSDEDCLVYVDKLTNAIKSLNKMQLLFLIDTLEMMHKYNWIGIIDLTDNVTKE
ncbi:MAG: helix-turn-helix transcriptional regulator [Clostridia bacterium]|nr:helix-turn-helix transcriptional regulator [Clostridia bacterium]